MLSITKTFRFESAHYLEGADYGKCQNMHGHSYILEVEVGNTIGPRWMVMNFSDLKAIVKKHIIDKCDHKILNDVFDWRWPTAEWLVIKFADLLEPKLPEGLVLKRIRLWETANSYAEWTSGS